MPIVNANSRAVQLQRLLPRGEALVALDILTDQQPQLIKYAVLIHIRARPRDNDLQAAVCDQSADRKADAHCGAEAASFLEKHKRQ